MRAVVQRVREANVVVDGEVVGAIDHGLLVYLGVGKDDTDAGIPGLLEKLVHLRISENEAGKFDKSLLDVAGSLLVVSQFTLYADMKKGRRPSFDGAMRPAEANRTYEAFVAAARARLGESKVATGRFGAHMDVTYVNDGPITLWLDERTFA